MQTKRLLVVLFIVGAMLLGTVMPVSAAAALKIKIDNQSGYVVYLTMKGPQTYNFQLTTGINKVEMEKGTYSYSYYGCGKNNTGTFKLKTANEKFVISCGSSAAGGGGDTFQVSIRNNTGAKLKITLKGPQTYTLDLNTGTNKVTLAKGNYNYSYDACNKTNTGKFQVKNENSKLTLAKCKTSGKDAGGGTVSIVVNNMTGGQLTLYMFGSTNYTFYLKTGKTTITVIKGTYSYSMYSVCGYMSGSDNFKKKIVWDWWCSH